MLNQKKRDSTQPQAQPHIVEAKPTPNPPSFANVPEEDHSEEQKTDSVKLRDQGSSNTISPIKNEVPSNTLKTPPKYSINHASYLKERARAPNTHTPIFSTKEYASQTSIANQETAPGHSSQIVSQSHSKPVVPMLMISPNKRGGSRRQTLRKQEQPDDSRGPLTVEGSAQRENQENDNLFDQSPTSTEFRPSHVIFKKKLAIPALELFPNSTSNHSSSRLRRVRMNNTNVESDNLAKLRQQEVFLRSPQNRPEAAEEARRYATEHHSEVKSPDDIILTYYQALLPLLVIWIGYLTMRNLLLEPVRLSQLIVS